MADYKQYFSDWNPLNLYLEGKGNLPLTSYAIRLDGTVADKAKSTPKTAFETDDEYAARLQKEELDYLDYIKRQQAYNQLLDQQRWEARTKREMSLSNFGFNPEEDPVLSLNRQVENDVISAIDPATGELRNSALYLNSLWKQFSDSYGAYRNAYKDISNLGKALVDAFEGNDWYQELLPSFEKDVMLDVMNRGVVKDEAEFQSDWAELNDEDKLSVITGALGRKYFTGQTLEEFTLADDVERFDMLASYIKNSPMYESLASRHKKKIDWGDGIFARDWKETTDHVTNRFLRGITGNSNNIVEGFADVVGGGALAAVGGLGNVLGGLIGSVGEYAQSRIEGMGFEEDVDDYIAKRANEYINKKSLDYYNLIQDRCTDEEKQELVDRFEAMSLDVSPWYRAERGTSLTELTEEKGDDKGEIDRKLKQYANIATLAALYDEQTAMTGLKEFWENTIAGNQTTTDRILKTAATFGNTIVADAASLAGVIANPIFMAFNPEEQTLEGEGYGDALVKRNPLVRWANNLQETGAWGTEAQNLYKELGINANQIYKDVSDQNSLISWNDLYDIVGQYGFTAATTLLSLGGSAAVKGMATSLTKNALRNGTRGTIARSLVGKEAREALKAGLASGATEAEITAAKEAAAKIAANAMYKGNLGVGAMMGTAEGALEARATYSTFLEDNKPMVEYFDRRQKMLDEATDAQLRDYMLSAEYKPAYFSQSAEGLAVAQFSPEQYQQARQELQSNLDIARLSALERLNDDATDAAVANLISNSAINGFLNVFFKEAVMSRDVREASRIAQGKNKLTDLIDVVKKGDSWEAVVKKAITDNGKRNLWQATKSITAKTAKNAGGEFLEEYGQGISDQVARDALQYDLNQYIGTVFDKDCREAFLTDWAGMLNTGLNSIGANATSVENIKSGMFGALSSIGGGFSPAGIKATFEGFARGRDEKDKGFSGTAKWIGKNLSNLYLSGIQEAFRDYNEEYQSAKRLAESTNAWLSSEKNQELIAHIGGASGFKKAIEDAIIAGDEFNAHDSKLGLAVENVFMLQALKDTDYGRAMQDKLRENLELLDVAQEDGNFDANGNYIGNLNQLTAEGAINNTQADWVRTAINTYRNLLGDASRSTNLTDRQIVQRIGENAEGLLSLQNEVVKAQQRVKNIFRNDNLDPLAELAFVHALMSQENTRQRRDTLKAKLDASTKGSNLSDADKEALEESKLARASVDFLVEHGSLENAYKKRESLQAARNQASEDINNKRLSKEKRAEARRKYKELGKEINSLNRKIRDEVTRQNALEELEESAVKGTEGTENTEGNEEKITLVTPVLFTAGDIASMPDWQKAYVIANKEKYSPEQQKAVDDFLTISRKNLALESGDIELTNEEVAKDYIDLAALQRRADTYDRYLTEFIHDPRFLTTTALNEREKERVRTLRRLYKDDLKIREGESALEFKERLDKKVLELKDLNNYEHAAILNKLVHENKQVAQLHTNLFEAEKAITIYQLLLNVSDEDISLLDAAVKTLVANSGLSLREIKGLLDKTDTATIASHLSKLTSDGQRSLNKALTKRGFKGLDFTGDVNQDETMLAPTIQKIKDFVDYYSSVMKDNSNVTPQRRLVLNPNQSSQGLASRKPGFPNNPTQGNPSQKTENPELIITAPGRLGETDDLERKIKYFLESKGVNENVRTADNTKNPNVKFAVIRAFGEPVIFAVQATKDSFPGKTLNIEGIEYKIIGVVRENQSDTLDELGKEAFNSLSPVEDAKILKGKLGDVTVQFNEIKDPTFMSDLNLEDPMPLNLVYQTEGAIDNYVYDLVHNGKRVKEKVNGEEKSVLRDGSNHPVLIDDDSDRGVELLENFPINGATLQLILLAINFEDPESVKNAIRILKTSEYFKAFFDAWTDEKIERTYGGVKLATLSNGGVSNLYNILLGDFLFLGHSYPTTELNTSETYLNPRLSEGKDSIVIIGSNKTDLNSDNWPRFVFELPFGGKSNEEKERMALETLSRLLRRTDNGNGESLATSEFQYARTQLGNKNVFDSGNEAAKNREAQRIKGLIKAGIALGFKISSVDRTMIVPNPFASKTNSTKSNDKNASQVDPPARGVVPGGVVNPTDGSTVKGNPETPRQTVLRELNEAQKKAQAIVDLIIRDSKKVNLEDSNAETYTGEGGKVFARATSAEQAYKGAETEAFSGSKDEADISTAYGNTIDPVVRAAFKVLNEALAEGKTLNKDELLKKILELPKFLGKEHIPNWNDYHIKKYLDLLIAAHLYLTDIMGFTIVPEDVKTTCNGKVYGADGTVIGTLPVAGTLDLLAYDREGIFHVIDIKTIHWTSEGEAAALARRKPGWEAQTSTYLGGLLQLHPDMEFGQNYIFPTFLEYSMPNGKVPVDLDEDGMTVKNYNPQKEPRLRKKASLGDGYAVEDFLFPLDTLEFSGYEYDRLSDADKARVIPIVGGPAPIVPDKPEVKPEVNKAAVTGDLALITIDDALNDMGWDSRRTTRQAKYTEFINNHIAPVTKVKIGIVARVASVVKNLFNKEGKQVILKKELANIFFNGDTDKLELVLKGLKITEDSLPQIVQSLRNYYESYVSNKGRYTANITKRYNISKAVCEYLKGNITLSLLEEELNKYLVTLGSVTELTEYMSAANKLEAAARILNKIETSRVNTQEKYTEDLKALSTTMESMQAKLDFLNSASAVNMLINRVHSVQEAIENGSYEEYVYKKNAALDDLLNTKSGSYGATKLLRGIALRTKNGNFKRLATVLLRQIKEKNLVIPITVEDGSLNFVEGTTKGRSITINKTSLDSYEHLERVLLHEMLHAVVKASPEMRGTLQSLLDLAVLSILKDTGKTPSEIKKQYYGLSSVEEFISEFFTNYAFQETLKTLGSDTYSNMFDKLIGSLKEKFMGDTSLYSKISEAMESVLNSTNTESTYRRTEKVEQFRGKEAFSDLNNELLAAILSKGISKEEYDSMTSIEQEHLKACCR